MSRKTPLWISGLLVALFVVQSVYYYSILPAEIASHFDGAGNPNQFVSRSNYAVMSIGLSLFPIALITVLVFLLRRIPTQLFNLPHKEYWLTDPQRRGETLTYIQRQLLWICVGTLALLLVVNQFAIEANLAVPIRLSPMVWPVIGGFLLFIGVWVVAFYRHFRLPATS